MHGQKIEGISIISMETAVKILPRSILLIAVKNYRELVRQVNSIKRFDGWDCYIYPLLIEDWKWEDETEFIHQERIERKVLAQYRMNLKHRGISNEDDLLQKKKGEMTEEGKNIIPKMVFIVTNRCTLRCEGCLGRVPFFENPEDMDVHEVLEDMKVFLECIDECIAIEIAGGEPLLYPDLDILLDYLIPHKKVLEIRFTTNGTVVPKESVLNRMAHEKVYVGISDYGMIDRLAKVVYAFEKHNVHFTIYTEQKWIAPGDLNKRNKTQEVLKQEYEDCWDAFNCKVIVKGRLFVCPRYARLYMQNIHEFETDSIYLKDYMDLEQRRDAVYRLYLMEYAESCDYCDFGAPNHVYIEPGVQMNDSIYRSQYTLVKRTNF